MDTLDALRLFVSIGEAGSLSAAARLESVATSTVTLALQQLEERAGASLISRSTRRLSFTHEGMLFLADARRLLAEWDAAVAGLKDGPLRGPIKVTAPQEFGRHEVAPLVDQFLMEHPEVDIALHLSDGVVELVEHHIDVAVRFGPLTDSALKARLLLRVKRVVCASPSYWSEHGVPERPEDLASHNCLIHNRPGASFASWGFQVEGKPTSIRVKGNRVANDGTVLRHWALAGRGILRRTTTGIEHHLASGELVTALDAFSPGEANVYAVTPGGTVSQRVRVFIDFIETQLRSRFTAPL
jgi:DNA-binding transcriptional LysR family regulator